MLSYLHDEIIFGDSFVYDNDKVHLQRFPPQIQLIKSLIPRVPIYLYYVVKFMSIPEGPFM